MPRSKDHALLPTPEPVTPPVPWRMRLTVVVVYFAVAALFFARLFH